MTRQDLECVGRVIGEELARQAIDLCGGKGGTAGPCPVGKDRTSTKTKAPSAASYSAVEKSHEEYLSRYPEPRDDPMKPGFSRDERQMAPRNRAEAIGQQLNWWKVGTNFTALSDYARKTAAEKQDYEKRYWVSAETVKNRESLMDEAISNAPPLPAPITVFRGLKDILPEAFKVGSTVQMRGFQASSPDPHVAAEFAGKSKGLLMEIVAKSGLHLQRFDHKPDPKQPKKHPGLAGREFVMARDQRFRVTGMRRERVPIGRTGTEGKTRMMNVVTLEQL